MKPSSAYIGRLSAWKSSHPKAVSAVRSAALTAYWVIPSLLCLWLYWPGLMAWFQSDDFAWLGLRLHIHGWNDFWRQMFLPMAQGTIRPLSERGFFLLFSTLFGFDALPYRSAVFATQFANLALVSAITIRLTGSRLAGFLAPVLWAANGALTLPLSWTSSYNQVLCAFFLLVAFWALLEYVNTGRRRWYALEWTAFLLGFGALEVNVVLPGLTLFYALLFARSYVRGQLPLLAVSAVYTVLHRVMASGRQSIEVYRMVFDASMLDTLLLYWRWVLGPRRLADIAEITVENALWLEIAFSVVLLGFTAWQLWKRRWLAAFFLGWFGIVLAPVLPLRNHISDYYLTIPSIGVAMIGAWAVSKSWVSGWKWRIVAMVVASAYLWQSGKLSRISVRWISERSHVARDLFWGVARAAELHPGKKIMLDRISSEQFWNGVQHDPFRLIGLYGRVFLAPGADSGLDQHPEVGSASAWVFEPEVAYRAAAMGRAVVYDVSGPRLRNITSEFVRRGEALGRTAPPRQIEGNDPLYDEFFLEGWHEREPSHRWMSDKATVRLGPLRPPLTMLRLTAFRTEGHLQLGKPLRITITVNGIVLPARTVSSRSIEIAEEWDLPATLRKADSLSVTLAVEPVLRIAVDGSAYGLAFGVIGLR